MSDNYSVYEAKARLSAILRRVREGATVTVSHRGRPIAEIRPVQPPPDDLKSRLDHMADRRTLLRPTAPAKLPRTVARKPGALKRFLAERDK